MNSWATRRRAIYLGGVVLILFVISFTIFLRFWYVKPNCFDDRRNGDETGVDCGGSCSLVCSGEVLKPVVKWDPRLFEVTPGVWSVLAYVENLNTDSDATYAPYTFTIYDQSNKILIKREGATILPKKKTVGIFEGSILVEGGSKPKRATFDFGKIVWNKNTEEGEKVSITHTPILRLESTPRVEATIKNNVLQELKNIELVAVIFDGSDNAIAASRTFVEKLKKEENANVFFTWPRPFELGSKVCEKPSDIMLILDRSGSMASVSQNPPEPLSTAKAAAATFVDQLSAKDKVGMISFATQIKDPIDLNLTSDFALAKKAIDTVAIEATTTQYTNIYEAVHSAWQELISGRATGSHSKVLVLLTDGVANNPRNPAGGTEEDDIKYAESMALEEAKSAKKDGVSIYSIGLGKSINEIFLKSIASGEANYFFAPSAQNLEAIYKNISSDICKEMPARIEISYKIFGEIN